MQDNLVPEDVLQHRENNGAPALSWFGRSNGSCRSSTEYNTANAAVLTPAPIPVPTQLRRESRVRV
jgi:hypothetical protein